MKKLIERSGTIIFCFGVPNEKIDAFEKIVAVDPNDTGLTVLGKKISDEEKAFFTALRNLSEKGTDFEFTYSLKELSEKG